MTGITPADFAAILPELVLFGGALLVLMLDAFAPKLTAKLGVLVASLFIFVALLMLQQTPLSGVKAFGVLLNDGFSFYIAFLVLISAFLVAMLSWGYLEARSVPVGEFMAGLLVASGGMILMSRSTNLIVIFVALEILSIALYMMIAYLRTEEDSTEAGLKYFLLGAYASAFFVFGAVLVYGVTGSMSVTATPDILASPMGVVGLILLITGMGFKISVVPFHLWTADVYQGAPTPVTAFLSSGSKVAAVAALMRIAYPAIGIDAEVWRQIWPVLAALTMVVGNIIALVQEDVKRILAYSSIAHVGFVLMALAGGATVGVIGAEGALFYLLTYILATIGSFGVIAAMPGDERGRVDLDYVRGLGKSHPWLAGMMALFLLSLSGLPPLVGFTGKLLAFRAAIDAQMYYLAAFAALNSALAVYYYLRIIVRMYMEPREEPLRFAVPQMIYPALVVACLGVVLLGILPENALEMAHQSARAMVIASISLSLIHI